MYLLDTNVISETRKPRPHPAVLNWIDSVSTTDLRISAVTMGELQKGVELTRLQDEKKACEIGEWVGRIAEGFEVIPVDGPIFREWARLMHGRSEDKWEDFLIAATARVHRLIVVTRNTKDFKNIDVEVFNPFPLPGEQV
jgi:hypothetical protein